MQKNIDFNKYKMKTDLALDDIKLGSKDTKKYKNIEVIDINLSSREAKLIGKKKGRYITIGFKDIKKKSIYNNVLKVLNIELEKVINSLNIKKEDSCLVVGLGNKNLIYDSLGPKTIDKILITNHISNSNLRKVSSFYPNVTSNTGINTNIIIKGIVNTIKPDFVIIIDSLMSKNIDRLNKNIQITDTGIRPGSALGNSKILNSDNLNIPVISIGIPLTLDIFSLTSDYKNYEKIYNSGMMVITNDIYYLVELFTNLISSSLNNILHK